MRFLIGLLTVVLVLNCLLLILLVLIQLPKKEAGAGIAFGGAATDALFGAGSGTALTKITKYCAGLFLGLALFLSILNAHHGTGGDSLANKLRLKASVAPPVVPTLTPTNPA